MGEEVSVVFLISMKRWKIFTIVFLLLLACCWLFRYSILQGAGNYLIDENELKKAEVVFVLGGVRMTGATKR